MRHLREKVRYDFSGLDGHFVLIATGVNNWFRKVFTTWQRVPQFGKSAYNESTDEPLRSPGKIDISEIYLGYTPYDPPERENGIRAHRSSAVMCSVGSFKNIIQNIVLVAWLLPPTRFLGSPRGKARLLSGVCVQESIFWQRNKPTHCSILKSPR